MEISFFRSSSFNQYDYCQMSYYITYNLGHQQPSQKKANLGTISHKVFEVLANCKKTLQDNPKKKKFVFDDEELGKFEFTYNKLYSMDYVYELLNRSYVHYTTNTPHITYEERYDLPFCEKMVLAGINHNNGQYDPRNRNIIQAEPGFDLVIDEPWAKIGNYNLRIKGTIDLVTKVDDETLEIIDWKTGQRKDWATGETKDQDKLEKDFQLLLYHYAAGKLFPEYKYRLMSIFFLRDGGPFTLCFEEEAKKLVFEKMRKRMNEILANRNPKPINPWRSDFRCQKLCHYYKTNWPGTETPMCNYVDNYIKLYGIEKASKELKNESFTVGHYVSPGSIK